MELKLKPPILNKISNSWSHAIFMAGHKSDQIAAKIEYQTFL